MTQRKCAGHLQARGNAAKTKIATIRPPKEIWFFSHYGLESYTLCRKPSVVTCMTTFQPKLEEFRSLTNNYFFFSFMVVPCASC